MKELYYGFLCDDLVYKNDYDYKLQLFSKLYDIGVTITTIKKSKHLVYMNSLSHPICQINGPPRNIYMYSGVKNPVGIYASPLTLNKYALKPFLTNSTWHTITQRVIECSDQNITGQCEELPFYRNDPFSPRNTYLDDNYMRPLLKALKIFYKFPNNIPLEIEYIVLSYKCGWLL
jgi:hypothetical protein